MKINFEQKIRELPIWSGKIIIKSLDGGITNQNFLVSDQNKKVVVRLGKDILEHHIAKTVQTKILQPYDNLIRQELILLEYPFGRI